MRIPTRVSWPSIFTLLCAVLLAVVYIRPISDLDFGWQVRTGERILETGNLRHPDPFSYTIAGKSVPDHEWLYEAGLALMWRGFGVAGLKLVRVVLFAAPILILGWQLRQRGTGDDLILLTLILVSVLLLQFERLRPLVCSTIGLQLTAGWLQQHIRGQQRLDWKLPVTLLFWGNLHPAVLMGQALIVGAAAWEWIAAKFGMRIAECGMKMDAARLRSLTIWGGAALLASFVAPAPIARLLYPFSPELRHPAQRLFTEINPSWKFLFAEPWTRAATVWCALIVAMGLLIVAIKHRRRLAGWEWALFAGVSALAVVAVRALADWFVISLALVVPLVQGVQLPAFQTPLFRWQTGWSWVLLALFGLVTITPSNRVVPFQENPEWPHAAGDWMAAGNLPTAPPWKIFSRFNEGSYLIWRFDGRAQVYADTRGFYYPGELLEDSVYVPRCERDWEARLDRVLEKGTEYFLLPTEGADGELWRRVERFAGQPLYRDERFVILSAEQIAKARQRE